MPIEQLSLEALRARAFQLGWLVRRVAGGGFVILNRYRNLVATDLLDKAHKLSDADFKKQSDELNAEARKIAAGADPMDGLRNWMLREIACS